MCIIYAASFRVFLATLCFACDLQCESVIRSYHVITSSEMPGVNHQAEQPRPDLESKQKTWIFSEDLHASTQKRAGMSVQLTV